MLSDSEASKVDSCSRWPTSDASLPLSMTRPDCFSMAYHRLADFLTVRTYWKWKSTAAQATSSAIM
jgi:hypothetical protein